MTKQQKARAHLARAQELLQGHGSLPYNTRVTSNEALGFGTKMTGGVTAQDTERSAQDLAYKGLPKDIRTMIESELDNKQKWNLALSAKEMSASYEPYRSLHEGWIDDDASIMNNKDLVLAASNWSHLAYGYASEDLQKDKDLAWQMYMKDPKSICAYYKVLDHLPKIFEKKLKTGLESMKDFLHKKLGVPYNDPNYKNMQRLTRNSARQLSALFEEFLDKEREKRNRGCLFRSNELQGIPNHGSNFDDRFTKPLKWKPGIVKDAIDLQRTDIIREILKDPTAHIDDKIQSKGYHLTALQYAVQQNNHDIARLLINSGANINAKALISKDPPVHYTTLDIAILSATDNGDMVMVNLLLQNGARMTSPALLRHAILQDLTDLASEIINTQLSTDSLDTAKIHIDHEIFKNDTPLMYAIRVGKYDIAKLLVERGARISEGGKYFSLDEYDGTSLEMTTPLDIACMRVLFNREAKALSFVRYLLEKGADPRMMGKFRYLIIEDNVQSDESDLSALLRSYTSNKA